MKREQRLSHPTGNARAVREQTSSRAEDRRKALKKLGGGVLGLGAAALVSRESKAVVGQNSTALGQQLEGTWMVTVTTASTRYKSLITFTSEGGDVGTAWVPGRASLGGTGHGEWVRTGDREFVISGFGLWFDAGILQWPGNIRASIKLSETLNQGSGEIRLDVLDADGQAIRALSGTVQGTRLRVEV